MSGINLHDRVKRVAKDIENNEAQYMLPGGDDPYHTEVRFRADISGRLGEIELVYQISSPRIEIHLLDSRVVGWNDGDRISYPIESNSELLQQAKEHWTQRISEQFDIE